MNKATKELVFFISIVILGFLGFNKPLYSQSPPADPGVSWIMITFDQPPSTVSVEKAPLRYNKTFAVSFHNDDGIGDIYTEGFPFFTGIPVGNTDYPGLFYTDGCGNDISFKLSSNLFSFNGESGPDMHLPGNGYGAVTWPELDIMYNNNCGIYSHGISSDASSNPAFINYSIKRNESYIRRKLFETTPGGVQTRIFVNPNGNSAYSPVAFSLGYFDAFNQISQAVIGNNGGDVNAYANWLVPADLNRLIAEATNVMQLADYMFANSTNGANYWAPIFTHSIINQYPLADFHTDFNYIANTYGRDGLDNVWVTTEEEIISYLRVRDATTFAYGLANNTLLITLSGSIPSDMRFYPLSFLIDSDATITNIQIGGGTNNTFNGIGQSSSLINLEWDGRYIPDIVDLADSYVTIAEQTQTQYDCWIAMDYVYMVSPGPDRIALRDRLCAIENVTYDPGFCETCTFNLGADTTICQNNCVVLSAPFAEGNTYIWSNGSTTQTITVCPAATTTYWVELTTIGGCVASDTIQVNTLSVPEVSIGADTTICQNDCITLEATVNEWNTYLWSNDSTTQSITVCPADTSVYWVQATNISGCSATDTIQVNTLLLPEVNLGADTTICLNDCVELTAPFAEGNTFLWSNDSTSQSITVCPADTSVYWVQVTNISGCSAADSIQINILPLPIFELGPNQLVCLGDTAVFTGPENVDYTYAWFVNNNLFDETGSQLNIFVSDTLLIKLEVLNQDGCMASDSAWVYALEVPLIQVTPASATLCFGESVDLQFVTQNAISYSWFDGSTQPNLTFTPTVSDTTYQLWAMAANGYGCIQYDTAVVQVYNTPSFQLSVSQGNDTLCVRDSLTLKLELLNNTAIQYLIWDIADTLQDITETIYYKTISPSVSNWYPVQIISVNNCTDNDSLYIEVIPLPVMTISQDTAICFADTITIQASGGQSCIWYVDGISVSEEYSLTISPSDTTTYVAEITGNDLISCISSDSVIVIVHSKPSVSVSFSDTTICVGTGIILSATGATNYLWSDAQTGNSIVVMPGDSTLYTVIGSTEYGCSDTAGIQANVFPQTDVSFSGLLPVYCLSDVPSQLVGIPEGGLFSGMGTVAGMFNPALAEDGVHTITYTWTDENNCTTNYSLETRVFGGLTEIDLGPDSTICPEQFILLDAGEGFTDYYWSNGQQTQVVIISGVDYPAGTSRNISVVGVLDGCTASGKMMLTIRGDCYPGMFEEDDNNGLSIHPNPNDGSFKLRLPSRTYGIKPLKLAITSVGGLSVYERHFSQNELLPAEINIQIPSKLQGVFILMLQTDSEVYTSKIVVR
ncbi:MAG: hypothetical protein HOO86_12750 [Bacteroidales bacterium]|nr:hypothetical protein [Bacteroidales bacterium]